MVLVFLGILQKFLPANGSLNKQTPPNWAPGITIRNGLVAQAEAHGDVNVNPALTNAWT